MRLNFRRSSERTGKPGYFWRVEGEGVKDRDGGSGGWSGAVDVGGERNDRVVMWFLERLRVWRLVQKF